MLPLSCIPIAAFDPHDPLGAMLQQKIVVGLAVRSQEPWTLEARRPPTLD